MRILYLTPYVPSPVRVRPYQLIHTLAALGHDVTLICLAGKDEEPASLEALRRVCRKVVAIPTSGRQAALAALRALPSRQPLQAAYGESVALVEEAQRLADQHDIVHIEHLRGSSYGAPLRQYPLLLDAVDSISLLFERTLRQSASMSGRIKALLDLSRTRWAEGHYGTTFSHIVVTSAEDRWALCQLQAKHLPAPRIDVVSNGVDLETFQPASETEREPATIVLIGKMSYHANETAALWLGQTIMPLVWRERPDVRCLIVGREPTAAVRALGSDSRIVVTGEVASVAAYLHRATLAVAPLRYGVGIQNKVLEAMATATPVVATPQAARALNIQPGRDIAVATAAEQFAESILHLLDAPQLRSSIGAAGRHYVETYHNWHQSATRLVELYGDAQIKPTRSTTTVSPDAVSALYAATEGT